MIETKSMKRRRQRKARLSRIREESAPKPKSLEEVQAMAQDTAVRARKATIAPALLLSTALIMSELAKPPHK